MSTHDPRRRIDSTTEGYRVTFAKEVMGLPFPVTSVEVRRAHNADRALRAAELRFSRRCGMDWRMRADLRAVKPL